MSKADSAEKNGFLYTILATLIDFLRPYIPQIVPVVVCVLFIPLAVCVSALVGFLVWTSLPPSWEAPVYLQYGDGVTPYAHSMIPGVHPSQRYDVSLRLSLPLSESNLRLGNFMATLSLSTTRNVSLVTVRRPAVIVPPKPWWPFGPPNLVDMEIPMLAAFVPGTSSLRANITIGRKDDWRTLGEGLTRELNVASASLHGLVVPHGIRGLAIRFPVLSSLSAAFIFLCLTSTIIGVCVLPLMIPNSEDEDVVASPILSPKKRSSPTRRRLRAFSRSSTRTSSSHSSFIKAEEEEEEVVMPSAEEKAAPESLRQRRISTKDGAEGEE